MTKTRNQAQSNLLKHAIRGLTAAAVLVTAQPALANMPAPADAGYAIEIEGNEVTICPQLTNGHGFPVGAELLRRDASSGDVVSLGEQLDENGCFVDACVPEGSYEYGMAEPFSCVGMDEVHLMALAEVDQSLSAWCAPPDSLSGPQPYEGTAPWEGTSPIVHCGNGAHSNYGYEDDMMSGCSLTGVPSTLWGPYAIVFITGLAVMGASRRRKRGR